MCVNKVGKALDKVTGGMLGGLLGSDSSQPQVQAAPKQPVRQDSKAPDSSATIDRMQQAQNSMSGGIANTLYTDAEGVSDEDLRLGKKTLLGR